MTSLHEPMNSVCPMLMDGRYDSHLWTIAGEEVYDRLRNDPGGKVVPLVRTELVYRLKVIPRIYLPGGFIR